jgi:DNA-binding sugar fermentation-stimulating protein
MPIYYESIKVGTRRVDFLIDDKIVVELKALTQVRRCTSCAGLKLPGSI